jgi:hypothetical protein
MNFYVYILFIYCLAYSLTQDKIFNVIRWFKVFNCIKCTSYWIALIGLFIFDYKPFLEHLQQFSKVDKVTHIIYYVTFPIVISHFILVIYEIQYLLLDKKSDL